MARYRKVGAEMWADAKFRALSPMAPSGASLSRLLKPALARDPAWGGLAA